MRSGVAEYNAAMSGKSIRSFARSTAAFGVIVPIALIVVAAYLSLALLTAPVWVPYLVGRRLYEHATHRGRVFLVATRRRGWFEFVTNNVIPVLPPGIEVVWQEHANPQHKVKTPRIDRLVRVAGVSKPYLVVVKLWRNRLIPLHRELEPLQRQARGRDPEVQAAVAAIVDQCLEGR